MEIGIIGLGKMGGNLTLQAVEKGISVVGKARKRKPALEEAGMRGVDNYEELVGSLKKPRIIFLSLPAGDITGDVISVLSEYLEPGDVIIDGGNSFYLDSIKREIQLFKMGIHFLDCGTSGGVTGARKGACFMVGGRPEGIALAEPVFKKLAVDGGYIHTGKPGSGHYVKLVHNGIEFGMLQAIGEGVALLEGSGFDLDLRAVFENWSNGSVIRSWLVELMEEGLGERDLFSLESYVEDTGEVNWLVQDAINKEIAIPVISTSIMELFRSRNSNSDAHRAVALMRHGFGGHPFGKDENIAKERKFGRLEGL